MTQPSYADSTVAMTLYNLLCMTHGSLASLALFNLARSKQHPELTQSQSDRALAELVKRNLVLSPSADVYQCKDPQRRVVVSRDYSDDNLGIELAGWTKWQVRDAQSAPCNRVSTLPLDVVMREVSGL